MSECKEMARFLVPLMVLGALILLIDLLVYGMSSDAAMPTILGVVGGNLIGSPIGWMLGTVTMNWWLSRGDA